MGRAESVASCVSVASATELSVIKLIMKLCITIMTVDKCSNYST